jgi:Ca2+-binding EF-hand superfamily protein
MREVNKEQENLDSSSSDLIKHVFDEANIKNDQQLTFDELLAYLSQKSGRQFNPELLIEIFRTIDLAQSSSITLSEFFQGYSKAEHLIRSQIASLKSQLTENSDQLAKTQKKLFECKANKIQNMTENNLYATVKKVEINDRTAKNRAYTVLIQCESHEVWANSMKSEAESDQSFTIPVSNGAGDIIFRVFEGGEKNSGRRTIGEVKIPFRALADQELHEDNLQIYTNDGEQAGSLLISIQWIYDLHVYLEGLVKQYQELIRDDKFELENLEEYMKELKAPIEAYTVPKWIKGNEQLIKVEKVVSEQVQNIFDNTVGKKIGFSKMTAGMVGLFLTVSAFCCLERADFFNVINKQLALSVYVFYHYIKQESISFHFRLVAFCIVISEITDLVWMSYYVKVMAIQIWLKDDFVKQFVVVLSVFNFIAKIAYMGVFWKLSIDFR